MLPEIQAELESRMLAAQQRYGAFASTHEALGVATEEWDELRDAVRANDLAAVGRECIDLAAVLVRLACVLRESEGTRARSVK